MYCKYICLKQKYIKTDSSFLFYTYLLHSSNIFNIFSYSDKKPFKIFENYCKLNNFLNEININLVVNEILNPILKFNELVLLKKKSFYMDIVCLIVCIILIVSSIITYKVYSINVFLYIIIMLLYLIIFALLIYLNYIVKISYYNILYNKIDQHFMEINYNKTISIGTEWFVERCIRSGYNGYLGFRSYELSKLEIKYNL